MFLRPIIRRTVLTPLALLALALGGCGAGTVHLQGHAVQLTLSEYAIRPQNVSVPAGTIEIVAHNHGILTHDVAVERESGPSEAEMPALSSTGTIMPGKSGTLTITLRRPGRYVLASTIANQSDLGMRGTLTVR